MLATTLLIFLILMTSVIYCWKEHHCPGKHKRQHVTLNIEFSLLQLVQNLQRHRGMSMVIIHDNHAFTEEFTRDIFNVEKDIQYSLKNLKDHYADYQHILKNDQWLSVIHKWTSLKACWRDLDFISNLFAHNEVINEIIDVVQILAKTESRLFGKKTTQQLLHWPQLIEHLGVLRALGVYALSSQSHNSLMNISLTMADHIQKTKQILTHESAHVNDRLLFNNTEAMLRQIDDMMIHNNLNESVKGFYNDMTLLIDSWYTRLNRSLNQNFHSPDLTPEHKARDV